MNKNYYTGKEIYQEIVETENKIKQFENAIDELEYQKISGYSAPSKILKTKLKELETYRSKLITTVYEVRNETN